MNRRTMELKIWSVIGIHEDSGRHDWRRQQIWDAINQSIQDVGKINPYLFHLVAESSITLVAGTSVYKLDDYCRRPLELWTEDSNAHKVDYLDLRRSTRDGSRNPNAVLGPFGRLTLTSYDRTTTALLSGTSASVTEGDTTVTKTGGSNWTSDHVGKRLQLNGEAEDYLIASVTGVSELELDKPYRARLEGLGLTGEGEGAEEVSWAISPKGIYQVKFLPAPTEAATVKYRFAKRPRYVISDDDVPELQEEFHDLIWKQALKYMALNKEEFAMAQAWMAEAEQEKQNLKDSDRDDSDCQDTPHVVLLEDSAQRRGVEPGVSYRSEEY